MLGRLVNALFYAVIPSYECRACGNTARITEYRRRFYPCVSVRLNLGGGNGVLFQSVRVSTIGYQCPVCNHIRPSYVSLRGQGRNYESK